MDLVLAPRCTKRHSERTYLTTGSTIIAWAWSDFPTGSRTGRRAAELQAVTWRVARATSLHPHLASISLGPGLSGALPTFCSESVDRPVVLLGIKIQNLCLSHLATGGTIY